MAISVAVVVGDRSAEKLIEALVPRIKGLRVGVSTDASADFGPLITREHLEKTKQYVEMGVREGAELVLDGRAFKLRGYEGGFYLGPCLFDCVTPEMRIYKEESFGPVLSVVRAANCQEALRLPSEHPYGNGMAIFTRDVRASFFEGRLPARMCELYSCCLIRRSARFDRSR